MQFPKQHSWKNAFHSFEHCLVGYITGQAIHNLPITLYFAFKDIPDNTQIRPYFFSAKVESIKSSQLPIPELTKTKVQLTDVR